MASAKIGVNLKVLSEIQSRENLNDMAFAAKIGIDKTMLWRIKTGRNNPGHEFIAKFLIAYPNVKFEDIFFLKQPLHPCQKPTGTEGE
ncbi:MAG: helix-turn-helix transcriptional regulator [Thermoanaerobacteraceae bacterium]|nr:helix-turn-helix transcriptional regulator [Thermoanaerobacteraceae bacterium]